MQRAAWAQQQRGKAADEEAQCARLGHGADRCRCGKDLVPRETREVESEVGVQRNDSPEEVNSNPPPGRAKTLHPDNGLPGSTPQEPVEPNATFVSTRLSDVICVPALSALSKRQRGEVVCVASWIRMQGLVTGLLPDGDSTEKRATEIADAPPAVPPPILTVASRAGVGFAAIPITVTVIAKL